jgi:Flp pilus assembly protein TadB
MASDADLEGGPVTAVQGARAERDPLARFESRWDRIDLWIDVRRRGRLRGTARDLAFADALRVVAAATRAGATIQQALLRASQRSDDEVARECGVAAARIALGRAIEEEVDALASRIETPSARLFAQVVRVQHRRGGDLAGPCHRLAALLHERARLDAEARSATAQARFSARAVLAIPVLLVVAAAWRSPDTVRSFLEPASLLLAAPGMVLIVVGALVARRIANAACDVGAAVVAPVGEDRAPRRLVRRIAGTGASSLRAVRLSVATLACCVPTLLVAGGRPAALACTGVAVACAAAWPWAERSRIARRRAAVAQSGIESLLEVSIALLAAGATAHEVATLAPAEVSEPLRSALAPAVHRVGLGRTIASAYDSVPEVAASPQLDGWLHTVCTSAELGAPAVATLEQLLRDARAARREQIRSMAQTAAPRMQLALVLLVVPGVMWLMLLATLGGLVEQLRASGVV